MAKVKAIFKHLCINGVLNGTKRCLRKCIKFYKVCCLGNKRAVLGHKRAVLKDNRAKGTQPKKSEIFFKLFLVQPFLSLLCQKSGFGVFKKTVLTFSY